MKQVPLCFVLMTCQKKIDYSIIRTIIGLLSTEPAVEEIIVNFERVVWATLGWCIPTDTVRVSLDTSKQFIGVNVLVSLLGTSKQVFGE